MNSRLLYQACLVIVLSLANKPFSGLVYSSLNLSAGELQDSAGPWPRDLTVRPSPSIDKKEFEKSYREDKPLWDKAFAFLNRKDLASLAPGKYPIQGEEVFATVTERLKEFSVSEWESHNKYLDIHYVISGKQKLGINQLPDLPVRNPYDEKRDVTFYTDNGKGKYYILDSTTFFICFPDNPHRPDIRVDGYSNCKKLVIKIRTK